MPEYNGARAILELLNIKSQYHQIKFLKSGKSVKLYQRFLRLVRKVR